MRPATLTALVCVALLAARVPFLFHPAVWIDEAFSLYHARHSLSVVWGLGWELESSPPLYYSAIWAWTHLFGDAEAVARSLSLLLTALAALCVHGAGACLGGRRAGAVAAVLFLCQPLMFAYSLEIRPYGLQVLLVAAAVWAFARLLVELESGRLRSAAGASKGLAPIVAAAALATYTHSTTPAFVSAMAGAGALYGVVRRSGRTFWVAWLLSGCAVLLAVTPHLLVMLDVIRTNERGIAWIPWPDLRWVYTVLRSLAIGENSPASLPAKSVGSIVIGLLAWSTWRLRDRLPILVVGLVLPALGFACLWAVSLIQPVLMPRTALWLVVPLCLLAGCGLATVQWQDVRSWLAPAMIVFSFVLMSAINMNGRADDRPWPRFFDRLAQEARPADEVVAGDPEVLCVLDYYAATEAVSNIKRWRLERGPDQSYRSHQRIPLGCNEAAPIRVEQLATRLARGTAIWLLAGDDLQRADVEAVLKALGESATISRRYEWRGNLAWRVERR